MELPSLTNFKRNIISLVRPKPKPTFGIHDPTGLRHLFQLRAKLSPLKYHKRRHNFEDTPSDLCECLGGIEDTPHFLFYCLRYTEQRISLASVVVDILQKHNLTNLANETELYLYGNKTLTENENQRILQSTIRYIKCTQRFSLN